MLLPGRQEAGGPEMRGRQRVRAGRILRTKVHQHRRILRVRLRVRLHQKRNQLHRRQL